MSALDWFFLVIGAACIIAAVVYRARAGADRGEEEADDLTR